MHIETQNNWKKQLNNQNWDKKKQLKWDRRWPQDTQYHLILITKLQ